MQPKTIDEIEKILRRKYYNENLLKFHNETAVTTILSHTPPHHSGESKIEKKALAITDARYEMQITNVVLNCTNQQGKDFIALRYFEDKTIKEIEPLMMVSKKTLERMRNKILNDAINILNLGIDA